jgi:Spy/CpxP family protein refolding chaperone
MSKQVLAKLCLAACLASPCALWALPQDSSAAPQVHTPPSPEQVVGMMADKLSLSADQKNALTPIIADRQQRLKAVAADDTASRRQRGQQLRQIMSDSDAKINAILTPDQQTKYQEIEQQMRQQMKRRMQEKKAAGES